MSIFSNKKILIAGGAGFVGSNLCKMLLGESDASVVVIDNLLSAEEFNLPEGVEFINGSLSDDAVISDISDEYDYIFNLVTYHGNQSSIHDPMADHENNLLPMLKIINRVKDFKNLKKLVYSGAGCAVSKKNVWEDTEAVEETDVVSLDMDSPYSISKIVGEFYSAYFHKQHNVPVVRARFQNVYGPGEFLGAGRWRGTPATVWRNVTPVFIYRALNGLPLTLDNDGQSSRDFIYVEDICRGLLCCADKGEPGDVYNLSSGSEVKIRTLAEYILDITGSRSELQLKPLRSWDTSICRYGSTEKSESELGFRADVQLKEGLKHTIDWTVENMDTINKLISKHEKHMAGFEN